MPSKEGYDVSEHDDRTENGLEDDPDSEMVVRECWCGWTTRPTDERSAEEGLIKHQSWAHSSSWPRW